MVDFFDKIVKIFTKLDNYRILSIGKDHLVIGTGININVFKGASQDQMNGTILSKNRDFPVYFLVTSKNFLPTAKDTFYKTDLPILKLEEKDLNFEDFVYLLNKFIKKSF